MRISASKSAVQSGCCAKGLAGLAHLAVVGALGKCIGLANAVEILLARVRLLAHIDRNCREQLVDRAQLGLVG